jgi:hypothetical protein
MEYNKRSPLEKRAKAGRYHKEKKRGGKRSGGEEEGGGIGRRGSCPNV